MKKILLSIFIVLLVILCGMTFFNSFLGIKSIEDIENENDSLDSVVAEATKIASTDYAKALEDIKVNMKSLEDEKKAYEDLLGVNSTTDEEGKTVAQTSQKYEIEYLWAVIGNHAKSEGVEIKMELLNGVNNGAYNLRFTVGGEYIEISDFVYALENDSVLGFKIEEFQLVPSGGENNLQATFVCKNIQIENITGASAVSDSTSETTDSAGTTNTTDTTTQQNTQAVSQEQSTQTTQSTQALSSGTVNNGTTVTQ